MFDLFLRSVLDRMQAAVLGRTSRTFPPVLQLHGFLYSRPIPRLLLSSFRDAILVTPGQRPFHRLRSWSQQLLPAQRFSAKAADGGV